MKRPAGKDEFIAVRPANATERSLLQERGKID